MRHLMHIFVLAFSAVPRKPLRCWSKLGLGWKPGASMGIWRRASRCNYVGAAGVKCRDDVSRCAVGCTKRTRERCGDAHRGFVVARVRLTMCQAADARPTRCNARHESNSTDLRKTLETRRLLTADLPSSSASSRPQQSRLQHLCCAQSISAAGHARHATHRSQSQSRGRPCHWQKTRAARARCQSASPFPAW